MSETEGFHFIGIHGKRGTVLLFHDQPHPSPEDLKLAAELGAVMDYTPDGDETE